jgi:hypothetical protein
MAKPDWLTIDGIGTGSPTFSCTANTGGQRDYSFKLVQDETGDELDIVITQEKAINYTFTAENIPNNYNISFRALYITQMIYIQSHTDDGQFVNYTASAPTEN